MKYGSAVCLGTAMLLCLAFPALAQTIYTGSLSSSSAGEIAGSGVWIDPGVTTVDWIITQNPDTSWHYIYALSVPTGEVSHFILQVSPTFTEQDILAVCGTFEDIEIETFYPGGSNPNMPGPIYGIKFDDAYGTVAMFELDTYRVPIPGHFFAKDGKVGGVANTAYDAGFASAGGSLIMVPDTDTYIPEPAGLLALLIGLTSLASFGFRRRRRW